MRSSDRLRQLTLVGSRGRTQIALLLLCTIGVLLFMAVPAVQADDPTFTVQRPFGIDSDKTHSLAAGDMDGDGDLDLVVGTQYQQNKVFLNDGAGNFPTSRNFGDGTAWTRSVAVGDLDGDGDLDIATGNVSQQNVVYLNDGKGIFYSGAVRCGPTTPTPNTRCFGTGSDATYSIALGDVNLDGALDIAVGNNGLFSGLPPTYAQQNVVYLNDGKGIFYSGAVRCGPTTPTPNTRCFGTGSDATESIALGDTNRDNDLDLIVGNNGATITPPKSAEQNMVYQNNGDGNYFNGTTDCAPTNSKRCFGTGKDHTESVAVGDFDGDGDLDLVAGNDGDPSAVYLNNPGNDFTTSRSLPDAVGTRSVAVGDLDGDGDLDIVAGANGQSVVLLNDGAANFTSRPIGHAGHRTLSVVVGDFDGDGHLDIATSGSGEQSLVYLNDGAGTFLNRRVFGVRADNTSSVEVADLDGNGYLDIIALNRTNPGAIYLNDGNAGFPTRRTFGIAGQSPASVVVGDLDGDHDLDFVGRSSIYLNNGAATFSAGRPFGSALNTIASLAVGDLDGDGHLDIVAGMTNRRGAVYLNDGDGQANFSTERSFGIPADRVSNVVVGDFDNDGDLDIVARTSSSQNVIYLNDGAAKFPTRRLFGAGIYFLSSGDLDGDGDLDLAGITNRQNMVSFNDGTGAFPTTRSFGGGTSLTRDIVLGDVDGDGDLDFIAGAYASVPNGSTESMVYLNDGAGGFSARRTFNRSDGYTSVAAGDLDHDGDLDLIAGVADFVPLITEGEPIPGDGDDDRYSAVYLNQQVAGALFLNDPPRVVVDRPVLTANAPLYSAPEILSSPTIPIPFSLADTEADPVRFVRMFYSMDGGGRWLPAVGTTLGATGVIARDLPTNADYTFRWNTFASGFFGKSDNIVFRIEAYPSLRPLARRVPGPFQHPYTAAQTFPFRVRGTQVQVKRGQATVPDALVYRLPKGDTIGGAVVGNSTAPFRTDAQGFLQGRGTIAPGDRLLALAPISKTDTYTIFHTSGTPIETGVTTSPGSVTQAGVQILPVSPGRPLVLFNIQVSLEWDAHDDPLFLEQIQADLKRASHHLYDFTNGQVALGKIIVHQNADEWANADIVVHATNRLRPFAAQGGTVLTPTVDRQHPDIVYNTGQVHIGSSWSRYGVAGQSLGDDWPLILAHELGHYLLFLDDTYLGTANGRMRIVDTCLGSAMADVYTPANTEFIFDQVKWTADCGTTLANQTLGRTEWQTIHTWYPDLITPTKVLDGPSLMPFDFTTITVQAPVTPTNTLEDPTFVLHYANSAASSSEARAFLLRQNKYVLDLGSPTGGLNRVLARGAVAGDRLCVFDRLRTQYGCESLTPADRQISLEEDVSWTPIVKLTPVSTRTMSLVVEGVPTTLTLSARLFSEYSLGTVPIRLTRSGGRYTGTFPDLDSPAPSGHVQVWVEETDALDTPRRETMVAYAIGGNPGWTRPGGGWTRPGGGWTRPGGGMIRASGGWTRPGGAPVSSPDGQLFFSTDNPLNFAPGDLFTVQGMAGLPPLPQGKQVIVQGNQVVVSPGAQLPDGSVSYQYFNIDALQAGITEAGEAGLRIHFWTGSYWEILPTLVDSRYNLASARSRGAGIYVLLAGVTRPNVTSISPNQATNDTTITLTINGSNFLPPVKVELVGNSTNSLKLLSQNSTQLKATVPAGLTPDAYRVRVVNGDGGRAATQPAFSLYPATPSGTCLADDFGSGLARWIPTGAWNIVDLPGGGRAITDSPGTNYNNAQPPATERVTSLTSRPFSLVKCSAGSSAPKLIFRHDYRLARTSTTHDLGRVAISTDNGTTWTTLTTFGGGGVNGTASSLAPQADGDEWGAPTWKAVQLDLSAYAGATAVRLRFSLEVDQELADKGWLLDDLMVTNRAGSSTTIHLPMLKR